MTAVSINKFGGMFPRTPPQLLPDNAAALADDCDFSKDVLGPLKGGLSVFKVNGNPATVKGLYTRDGTYWYTWDFETTAYQSPVIGETYNRIYYVENNKLYVAISPDSSDYKSEYQLKPSGGINPVTIGGGPPRSTIDQDHPTVERWLAGVPNPTVAPTLTLEDRNDLADYPNAAFSFRVWWTDGSTNYGARALAAGSPYNLTTSSAFRTYTFTAPTPPADAPEGATLVVEATLAVPAGTGTAAKTLFTLNSSTNATVPVRSSALPGGVEMLVSLSSATYTVTFSWGVVETRAYVYTVQNLWDEESGPSPAALISPTYLQNVKIATTRPTFTNYRGYKQTNIYRTYGSGSYIKTSTTSNGSTTNNGVITDTFTDSSRTVTSVGVALTSMEWTPCPTGISNNSLVLAPNGWFACFKGNTLYMSEPYRPHTWPYSITFPKSITGICVGPQGLVVTTYSACYLVLGPHPASANQQELSIPVGGISQRGMVKYETGVAFLSNDGIVLVEGSQASLDVSQRFFTREKWRELYGSYLSSLSLGYHDGFLVCTSNETALGFLVRLDEAAGAFTKFDYQFGCMMRLATADALYYPVTTVDGGVSTTWVYQFREGSSLTASWNSKEFIFPQSAKLGVAFLRFSGTGTITLALLAEGAVVFTYGITFTNGAISAWSVDSVNRTWSAAYQTTTGNMWFRLPPHRGAFRWQVNAIVAGACTLDTVAVAQTMDELKHV